MANLKHMGTGQQLLLQTLSKHGAMIKHWNRPSNPRTAQLQSISLTVPRSTASNKMPPKPL